MKKCIIFIVFVSAVSQVISQTGYEKGLSAISESAVKGQLEFLASDWTEGRATGTKGAYLAADYIAAMFKTFGLEPYGDEHVIVPSRAERWNGARSKTEKTYFQNFSLIEYEAGDEQNLAIISSNEGGQSSVNFNFETDFYVRTGTVGGSGDAPCVFAGYGISDKENGYDDLKKIDLNGKIAIVLAGYPGHKDTTSQAYEKFHPKGRYGSYYFERNKIENLEKLGAIAVVTINLNGDPSLAWSKNDIYPVHGSYYEADQRLKSFYDTRLYLPDDTLNGSIPVFTVTKRVANAFFSGTGVDISEFEQKAQDELISMAQQLKGKSLAFKTTVKSKVIRARNVLGYIEGKKKDEFVVLGAHYDHLGKYDGWIWNGADDNASGTVGIMTIARAFMATGEKPEKSIIFAAWTGEEKGLYGSKYFVKSIPEEDDVRLYMNYDMIARNSKEDTLGNQAAMTYTEAYGGIRKLTEKNLEDYDINLDLKFKPSKMPTGGSDHTYFTRKDIPIFYFMAAMHPDYHQPSDEIDKINWEKLTNIIKLGFLNTWNFANSDDFLKLEKVKVTEEK